MRALTPRLPKDALVPIALRVAEAIAISCCFKLGELPHVDAVAMAQREKLPEIVISGLAFETNYQAVIAFAVKALDARDARQPFEERPLVVLVIESNAFLHFRESEKRGFFRRHVASLISIEAECSPHERSDMRDQARGAPHIASFMRATIYVLTRVGALLAPTASQTFS
jgi:hypothetical protein